MSGGSWEYFYDRLRDVANRLENQSDRRSCPAERVALGKILKLAATMTKPPLKPDPCRHCGANIKRHRETRKRWVERKYCSPECDMAARKAKAKVQRA